jgi:hypothetical protein
LVGCSAGSARFLWSSGLEPSPIRLRGHLFGLSPAWRLSRQKRLRTSPRTAPNPLERPREPEPPPNSPVDAGFRPGATHPSGPSNPDPLITPPTTRGKRTRWHDAAHGDPARARCGPDLRRGRLLWRALDQADKRVLRRRALAGHRLGGTAHRASLLSGCPPSRSTRSAGAWAPGWGAGWEFCCSTGGWPSAG